MGVNILILLLLWSNIVSKGMAGCTIQPDSNGNVTIPYDCTSDSITNIEVSSLNIPQCSQ